MAKYRKKPVIIEAVQYVWPSGKSLVEFTNGQFRSVDPDDRLDDLDVIAEVFDTLHSTWVGVKDNQWIIRGVQGEYYPCDPDVFQATYDEVPN